MHRAKYVIPVLFALAALLGITGWWLYRAAQPIELALYFHPFVGPEPLVLNESRYANPGGDRKSTRLNSSHIQKSRMPSSA